MKKTLRNGYHWIDHPSQGTIIVKVEGGLIYQMATLASRQADDEQFNKMGSVLAVPHDFSYCNEAGWF